MGEDVLPEQRLLEKATTIKRFEYSPLNKEKNKLLKTIIGTNGKFAIKRKIFTLFTQGTSRKSY